MTRRFLVLVFALFTASAALAQGHGAKAPEEMKKLDWLVGEWSGGGWIMMGRDKRETFKQTESIQYKLEGAIVTVDGLGLAVRDGNVTSDVVHRAFGVFAWDAVKKEYRFVSWLGDGKMYDSKLELNDRGAVWGFADERGMRIRFTITLTDKGEWNEVGEMTRDGEKYFKFFEMTLAKKK